jgi:hypothetical protein
MLNVYMRELALFDQENLTYPAVGKKYRRNHKSKWFYSQR